MKIKFKDIENKLLKHANSVEVCSMLPCDGKRYSLSSKFLFCDTSEEIDTEIDLIENKDVFVQLIGNSSGICYLFSLSKLLPILEK